MGAGAKAGVTSGGVNGTSGAPVPLWRRPALLALAAFAGFGLVYLVVNATSLIDERRALGRPIEAWKPWLWEATSYLGWLILLPGVLWLAAHLARGPLWRALAGHALAFPLASIVHTGLMIGMRHLGYWPTGEPYTLSGPLGDVLVYELRKDVITYGSVVLAYLVLRRLAVPAELPAPAVATPPLVEVRDGSRAMWLRPDEIDWVAAAGNYVELHGPFGTQLTRRTLAEMEAELTPLGFVRVHRSRLVRRDAIVSIETRQSGDFDLTLRGGTTLAGSRRFRGGLQP